MGDRYKSSRTVVAVILIIATLLGFGYDLYNIQIKNNEYYVAQSSAVKTYTVSIEAARGEIVDRNGNTLVTNRKGNSIILDAAYFPSAKNNDARNAIIINLIKVFNKNKEEYVHNLPLKIGKNGKIKFFTKKDDENYESAIKTMKSKDMFNLQAYATAQNCFDAMVEKYGLEKGSYVLYIGRLSPEKGIQDLISAYRKSGIAKKLVVAGEAADSAFLDDLRALAGDGGDVMFAGLVSGELMNSLYCNTALYVLPSHTEGLALTLLEALSCGADCLVSNIEENTSVAGKYAETFESGNVDDLADKLVKCADRIKAPSESEEQKKYVSANYGYDRVIDEHMKIYNALVRKEERNA